MKQKELFQLLLAGLAIMLLVLPTFAALNSLLTEIFDKAAWYRPIQQYVVPWEARLVSVALMPLGIESKVTPESSVAALYMIKQGASIPVDLSWNCLGWQSILLLLVSFIAGLRGNFTAVSRIKCILFGLLGTILVNVFRMTFIAGGIYYVSSLFGMIIHDYFAAFITIIWLGMFWWVSFAYILEERTVKGQEHS